MPGLVAEILAIGLAIRGHFAHRLHCLPVYLVIGVFGDKSTVRLDGGNPALLGKVRGFLDVRDARCPRLPGNQTYRQRPLVEVPHFFSRSAHNQRSSLNSVLVECSTQFLRQPGLELVNECLARWQAQIVDLGHGGIGVLVNANDQA